MDFTVPPSKVTLPFGKAGRSSRGSWPSGIGMALRLAVALERVVLDVEAVDGGASVVGAENEDRSETETGIWACAKPIPRLPASNIIQTLRIRKIPQLSAA